MSYIFSFIEQWLGGLYSIIFSFSGLLFCVLVIGAFWDRRLTFSKLVGLLSCGLTLTFHQAVSAVVEPFFSIEPTSIAWIITLLICGLLLFFFFRKKRYFKDTTGLSTELKSSIFSDETQGRSIRGTKIGAPLVIAISVLAVQITGFSAPQVMIGDEVTHYFMLTHQAEDLTQPNFYAEIPNATGSIETRRYSHPFLWHYLGAVIFHLSGGSFVAIQLYQSLFFLQLLTVVYLLARERNGVESRSALVYVLVVASLPLSLIFSVAFYQDVPMTAQVVTAFYLLRKGNWFWAAAFLALAIGFKVTASLFFPSFFLLLLYWQVKKSGWLQGLLITACALAIVMAATWQTGKAIKKYGDATFYPQAQLEKIIKKVKRTIDLRSPVRSEKTTQSEAITNLPANQPAPKVAKKKKPKVIANHPGDLRVKMNYLIYGGILVWLTLLIGSVGYVVCGFSARNYLYQKKSSFWLYLTGGTYTLIAVWFIRTAPDARFFLPALPFLLLPFVEKTVCLPKPKLIISFIAALAFLQGGYVLQKTYNLRAITPEIREGIAYLETHPPSGHIFMYPEGNYRFFPAQHEWYLGYRLRKFWRADNDARIKLLKKFKVSTIVIKIPLVAQVDEKITNLGVYPISFVKEIEEDPRFKKIFVNSELVMYRVPAVN